MATPPRGLGRPSLWRNTRASVDYTLGPLVPGATEPLAPEAPEPLVPEAPEPMCGQWCELLAAPPGAVLWLWPWAVPGVWVLGAD